jgi:hypothetical protein
MAAFSPLLPQSPWIDPRNGNPTPAFFRFIALLPTISFGAGAPAGTPTDGQIYFNTTPSPYNGYVGRGGAWHRF